MEKSKLMALTVKELRAMAESLDLKCPKRLRKREIVDVIVASQKQASTASVQKIEAKPIAKKVEVQPVAKKAEAKPIARKTEAMLAVEKLKTAKLVESDVEVKSDKRVSRKATKAKAKKDKKTRAALLEAEALEAAKAEALLAAAAAAAAEEEEEEEEHVEPETFYIDRGAILPQFVPGTALFAIVRDPTTLFVYWNASFESPHGWLLTAYDAQGHVLQSFHSPERRNGRGYFNVPTYGIARVTLAQVDSHGNAEVRLQSKIRLVEQSDKGLQEKWIDIKSGKVVYEAPAPGYAPQQELAYQRFEYVAGDAERLQALEQELGQEHGQGGHGLDLRSPSSRFGQLRAPGSADLLLRSSEKKPRRK